MKRKEPLNNIILKVFFTVFIITVFMFYSSDVCSGNEQTSKNFFWSLFIKGKTQGNLEMKTENADFEKEANDSYHLSLNQTEKSKIIYNFNIENIPAEYYILNDWKVNPDQARIRIKVNNQLLSNMTSKCNHYISQGFEISRLLRKGENKIEIELGPDSEQLWIRGSILTESPSLARNIEFLPDLLPSYARTLALILFILGILYLIWFFLNRTLYTNMDVFSASFAIIGIMIASIATAYCVLLISNRVTMSVVFLVLTIILALLAMLSVRKNESVFSRKVAEEGLQPQEEKGSSDFNF